MAKKWVLASFKSRGEAIDYCAAGKKIKKECGSEIGFVHASNKFIVRNTEGFDVFVPWREIWAGYENMMIEVDEPDLEIGKLYQVSDCSDFPETWMIVRKLIEKDESGMFVDDAGAGWAYFREISEELVGKIK